MDVTGDERKAYISGLRKFLDLAEAHEELPLPYYGQSLYGRALIHFLSVGRNGNNNKSDLAAAVRILPGPLEKNAHGNYFDLLGNIDGFYYQLTAYRDEVCERVVTGVETVTRTIPDPNAPVTPMIEVTEEVETIEWRCGSILADSR
jgi:hypothetical protein